MKGSIFNGFEKFVVDTYSLSQWQHLIDQCNFKSAGVYLATEFYEDQELVGMITELAKVNDSNLPDILRDFGQYIFPVLHSSIKKLVPEQNDLFSFLLSVDKIIHVQVKRSDPQAYTPTLFHDLVNEKTLLLRYVSHRKMCFFAEGLILGAANYYQTKIKVNQDSCCHLGAQDCTIRIER